MFRMFNGDPRAGVGYDADLAVTKRVVTVQTAQATKRSEPPLLLASRGYWEVTRVIRLLLVQPGYRSRLDGPLQA